VNAAGEPVSPPLLLSGSGSMAADEHALKRARAARFEPLGLGGPRRANNPLGQLTWGELIFEWQTVPATNAGGRSAQPCKLQNVYSRAHSDVRCGFAGGVGCRGSLHGISPAAIRAWAK